MPTFNILLAYDTTKYGCTEVEADTWEEAVASLTHDSWYDNCHEPGDEGWEQRVVDVETEDGDIVAEDIHYNCGLIHCQSVIQRLREIQIAAVPDAALALYIDELRTMGQDPIFKKDAV